MRSFSPLFAAVSLCVALAACANHDAPATAAASAPPLLIDARGKMMPLEAAVRQIAFRPFLPSAQILAFAVIPPLGGGDTVQHRGLGIEYVADGSAVLLSQWPRQNFDLLFVTRDITVTPCEAVHYAPDAVAWTSRSGLLLTLQPDGKAAHRVIEKEARRLLRAGACR